LRHDGEEATIATTEYKLDDGDVGAVFPEIDGYVLSLVRSRPPNSRGVTSTNWHEKNFVLRDARSTRTWFASTTLTPRPR
jgi:hypothetical protein